jgi:hypothetical protein
LLESFGVSVVAPTLTWDCGIDCDCGWQRDGRGACRLGGE